MKITLNSILNLISVFLKSRKTTTEDVAEEEVVKDDINFKVSKTNNGKKFGEKSLERLNTCHPDIQKVMMLAISRTKIDFGISEGYRDVKTQQSYYAIGRTVQLHRSTITNVDGLTVKGKHNYNPSQAIDIYVYHPKGKVREQISYDGLHLSYLAGLIDSCSQELYDEGEITHKIRWGGNWDSDGIIKFDQSLNDMPHFEINEA